MSKTTVKQIKGMDKVKLLKDPPTAFDDPSLAPFFEKQWKEHPSSSGSDVFASLRIGSFPGCCGIAVLYGMNHPNRLYNSSPNQDTYISKGCFVDDPKRHTLTVWGIAKAIEHWEYHRSLKTFGPMLLCSINDQQMEGGLHTILEDYFGFTQICADFKNKGAKDARVRLYSLMA